MKHRVIRTIFCAGLFLAPYFLLAQSSVADSLAQLLVTAPPDTHRVSLLTDYAWEINDAETGKAISLLWEAVALAQKFNYSKGEATAWNGLGVAYEYLPDDTTAIKCYNMAMTIREDLGDKLGVSAVHNNLGNIHEMQGEYVKALPARRESLRIVEALKDTIRIARAHLNLGGLFVEMGLYSEAFEQTNFAREIFEIKSDSSSLARTFTTLGHIRYELETPAEAMRLYTIALGMYERLGDQELIAKGLTDLANALDESAPENADTSRLAIGLYLKAVRIRETFDDQSGLASLYNNLGVVHKHLKEFEMAMQWLEKSLKIRTELEDSPGLMEVNNSIGDVYFGLKKYKKALDYTKRYAAIAEESDDKKFILKSYKDFAKIYAAMGDWPKAYDYRLKYDEYKWRLYDENRAKILERREVLFNDGRRQREIDRQQQELAQAQTRAWALIAGALVLALLAALLFNRNRIRARANRDLASKNAEIQQERERADSLLKNILPEKTAQELKEKNSVQPVRYESVTVLFSDFKNFTSIAEKLSPEELVAELDACFRLFDHIIEEHGLEKIKTIGDAYMCAGGIPEPNKTHALDTVRAAIEMQRGLQNLMEKNALEGKPIFEMRIGIHTGPVVAGVVGSRKFAYDIWGDTVNTAARLEHGSEAGKINISQTTWEAVRAEIGCRFRGKLPAKNKGEIAMYFVED